MPSYRIQVYFLVAFFLLARFDLLCVFFLVSNFCVRELYEMKSKWNRNVCGILFTSLLKIIKYSTEEMKINDCVFFFLVRMFSSDATHSVFHNSILMSSDFNFKNYIFCLVGRFNTRHLFNTRYFFMY